MCVCACVQQLTVIKDRAMGFIGRIRGHILKNFDNGVWDVAKISNSIVQDARNTIKLADIGSFFTPTYLREVNKTLVLGKSNLFDFVRAARDGDYRRSFAAAFPNVDALNNRQVRNVVNGLLNDARTTLPDSAIRQNIDAVNEAKRLYGLDKKPPINTVEGLQEAVDASPQLKNDVGRLVEQTNRTKTLKILGASFTFGVGVVTAAAIYDLLVSEAAKQSGCFAYWRQNGAANGQIRRCKVRSYSCKSPQGGDDCLESIIPQPILTSTECQKEENKQKNCIHCDNDDPANATVPENVTLVCEEKSAGDLLVEGITNTVGKAAGIIGGWFHWLIIVGVAIFVIVVVLVVVTKIL